MGIIVSGWEGAYYIAFCCISTGKFHFPNKDAAEIAIKEVQAYIKKSSKEIKIILIVGKGDRIRKNRRGRSRAGFPSVCVKVSIKAYHIS